MTLRQFAARILRRGRARWVYPSFGRGLHPFPTPLSKAPLNPSRNEASHAGERPHEELRSRASELAARQFSFLGLPTLDLGDPVDWGRAPAGNRLWQYELHYGLWALDLAHASLALSGGSTSLPRREAGTARDHLLALLDDWITHNPVGQGAGWEPYTICRRLVNWSRLAGAFDDPTWTTFWRQRLEPSLRQQARFLASNLEYDVPNNHLLANVRALAWVGLLFPHWPESQRFKQRGLEGLWREMERQVLADGVHEERSVSYHALVLEDLHETWELAQKRGVTVPATVEPTLAKMAQFLASTRAPDGSWPMVNDSVVGSPDPSRILAKIAHTSTLNHVFPDAGYAVLRDGNGDGDGDGENGYLFFDAGPMGPAAIPGHGHADFLSFELHGGGRPLVVDPGTDTYETGPRRDAQRSMAAHNTVTVDGVDPCLFWGPFRVAWPPHAQLLETSEHHLVGEHHGYLRLPSPVLHRRRIDLVKAGEWEIHDRFETTGEHHYALNLQFAPGARLEISEEEAEIRWPEGVRLGLHWTGLRCSAPGVRAVQEEGSVARGWNQWLPSPRFVLCWKGVGDCEMRLRLRMFFSG